MGAESRKPLHWIGSSLKDLKAMPVPVQKTFGTALRDVQYGEKPDIAKALSGFGGGSVLELVEDHDRRTFRAVYTVSFPGAVYVAARLPEEVETWHQDPARGDRGDQESAQTRAGALRPNEAPEG